jgi:3-hydroxyisobutyrate dehydrogenase-like beta-hydroxyacid dehydrogenase
MNVTIIGTGNMARGIGARLLAGGHEVTVLGKETDAAPPESWSNRRGRG